MLILYAYWKSNLEVLPNRLIYSAITVLGEVVGLFAFIFFLSVCDTQPRSLQRRKFCRSLLWIQIVHFTIISEIVELILRDFQFFLFFFERYSVNLCSQVYLKTNFTVFQGLRGTSFNLIYKNNT